jgi:hypothetical protein
MADLPLAKAKHPVEKPTETQVKVTPENAPVLMVHFLSQIHARLGYMIKLLEKQDK